MLQCDLINHREVSTAEGCDLAKSFGVPFFESSAKNRINVEEACDELVRVLFLDSAPLQFCFDYAAETVSCRSEKSGVKPLPSPPLLLRSLGPK